MYEDARQLKGRQEPSHEYKSGSAPDDAQSQAADQRYGCRDEQ
jgi:hypothetical protein